MIALRHVEQITAFSKEWNEHVYINRNKISTIVITRSIFPVGQFYGDIMSSVDWLSKGITCDNSL